MNGDAGRADEGCPSPYPEQCGEALSRRLVPTVAGGSLGPRGIDHDRKERHRRRAISTVVMAAAAATPRAGINGRRSVSVLAS